MQELVTRTDSYLFGGLGGFAIGAVSGYALRRAIKLAAIILGAFFLRLAYLSYKGWISANWSVIQNQTYSGMMNASQAAQQYIQSTMQHMSTHPALQGQGLTIVATIGFLPGLIWGLRK